MTNLNDPVSEQELHAYVDGFLSEHRIPAVEQYLANNSAELAKIKDYQNLNQLLSIRHKQIIKEAVPPEITAGVRKHRVKVRPMPLLIAASVVWAFVGGVIGWSIHSLEPDIEKAPFALAENAAYAHAVYTFETHHAVEVTADDEKHLVNWLSRRLHKNIRAPDLIKFGYELIGGRLLPSNGVPAAQFMYENKLGNRLTLYVRSNTGTDNNATFRYASQDNMSIFYWIDNSLGYALTGEVAKAELLDIATAVYELLEEKNPH